MPVTSDAAAKAVKRFTDQAITVTVPKLDAAGEPLRDKETKRFITETVDLAPEHVVGLRDLADGGMSMTVVDGQKYLTGNAAK